MLWRHLRLVRAWSAAGLFTSLALLAANPNPAAAGEPAEPLPAAESSRAETVKILDAKKAGDLSVDLRGHGQSVVTMTIKNTTARRLNVVLPPGLVAASGVGQAGGAGGAGGGLQSMGLGAPGNRPGGFGQFGGNNGANAPGFRSVDVAGGLSLSSLTVPAGKSVEVEMPAVCLNFGLPSPTPKDALSLVDVDDYSRDHRVRRALRSLATLGTSQGTAQAAMWSVCNGVPFETMLGQGDKVVNRHEVALASRFIEALDGTSSSSDLVDPAYLTEARVFVTVVGEPGAEKDAQRIGNELEGLRVLGLPARVSAAADLPKASGPALHMLVTLADTKAGETSARVAVRYASGLGKSSEWLPLGGAAFRETSAVSAIKGADVAKSLDHAVASAFVTARPARKAVGSTAIRIENRLPFSLASVTLKAGTSAGAPPVTFAGMGVGPVRNGVVSIQAPNATVDRVELNGL